MSYMDYLWDKVFNIRVSDEEVIGGRVPGAVGNTDRAEVGDGEMYLISKCNDKSEVVSNGGFNA